MALLLNAFFILFSVDIVILPAQIALVIIRYYDRVFRPISVTVRYESYFIFIEHINYFYHDPYITLYIVYSIILQL